MITSASTTRRKYLPVAAALIVPALLTLLLHPARSHFDNTDVALVLVVVIVGMATVGNRFAGIVSALSSSVWFDFFFTKPYEHFSITKTSDLQTTVLLLIVGIAASEIAARGRREHKIAREGANHLAVIHDFSEMVATGEPVEFMIIRAAAELTNLLHLKDCRFEESWLLQPCPRLEAGGEVIVQGRRWLVDQIGLPSPEVELLAESHGQHRGRFLLMPTPGQPVSLERRIVAVAIAGQVGAALAVH